MKKHIRRKSAVAAIVLFAVLFVLGVWQDSRASELYIGVGKTFNHSHGITQDLGYERNNWYLQATRIGSDAGLGSPLWRFSGGHKTYWRESNLIQPFLGLGATYFTVTPRSVINDRWAFNLKMGVRLINVVEIGYDHDSTSGRTYPNLGLDGFTARVFVPFGDR